MQALAIAGTVISTVGTLAASGSAAAGAEAEGKAQKSLAAYQASQLRYRAGQERAVSQQAAEQERRKARLAVSRGRAVAASGGGGVTDPTVMDILGALRGEGEYNAKSALYEGEEAAKGLENQANAVMAGADVQSAAANYKAKYMRRSGYLSAAGNLLHGSTSFYEKYWPTEDDAGSLTMNKSGTKFGKYSSQVTYG